MGGRPRRAAAGHRADRLFQEGSLRSCCLSLQPGRAVAEVRLRGLVRRAWWLHQARLQRHRLAAESLKASSKNPVGRTYHGEIRSERRWRGRIVGSGAGGGTLGNELAQKGVKVV